jgi:hypothetical protein
MRRFLVLVGVALTGSLATASPAAADDFKCNGVFTGTFDNVVVPKNRACTLVASNVKGNVKALRDAYFEADGTRIGGNVQGDMALTILIHDASSVGGNVQADKTPQLFLFDSTVAGDLGVKAQDAPISGFGAVQICGMTVPGGNIQVAQSGTDILIGFAAQGCPGNTVSQGNVQVEENFSEVEFEIRDNTISKGNLQVFKNRGPVPKVVQNNTGGQNLQCKENDEPFLAAGNAGWNQREDQCAAP